MSANSEDSTLSLKQAKWICLAVAATSLSIFTFIMRGFFSNPTKDRGKLPESDAGSILPPAPKPIQQAADQAYEEALVVKATNKVVAEEKKKQLAEIVALTDGKERRKRLAEYLRSV